MPTVSVLMAVHNGERFLEASVASLLGQSFADFELLLVDDGSVDRTSKLLLELAEQDARIRPFRREHRGLTASLVFAARAASGRYLARQDADDLSLPGRLEREVEHMEQHREVAVVGSAANAIDETGRVTCRLPTSTGQVAVKRDLRRGRTTLVHGSVMIRRSAFEAVGGYREAFRFTQDLDLWLRVAERFELDNLAGVFYQWRVSSEGIYTVHRTEQLKYGGLARVFARERRIYGQDSYEALHDAKDDLDAFAARYRLRGFLHARWGELLLRASQNTVTASEHFRRALTNGCIGPRVLALYLWSRAGLRWPGSSPLATSVPSGWRASS